MKNKNRFLTSSRPHIVMITNHGVHQWQIIPGLPDTGGQNVFVNQFTDILAKQGYKITVVNRGGYPHPVSGEPRRGVHYKDENQRILYLEDGLPVFIRKEDMDERLPLLAEVLRKHLAQENLPVDLIISHYWDGAKLGCLFNQTLAQSIKHIWVPHSLGTIKKKNVNPGQWVDLRIDERIENEKDILQAVDGVAATSAIIESALRMDYEFSGKTIFLPPCVDPERYYPHPVAEDHPIWDFLSRHCGLSPREIRGSQIITEISRTDSTKRKDVLIKAFAQVLDRHPNAMLVVSIEQSDEELPVSLRELIKSLGIEKRVAALGSVWDQLPDIYAVSNIYCTPSIMEGFGMTSQEAAATGVAVVASHLVPFVTEYLLGDPVEVVATAEKNQPIKLGQGAVVVQADDTDGFAFALDLLLSDPNMRKKLGGQAYQITIPYFTWENIVCDFLKHIQKEDRVGCP